MTAPMIGNYGINPDDVESDRPRVAGVVVRELATVPSNWRATGSLRDWLADARVPLVSDVDTRQLTRHIRSKGAMRGVVAVGDSPTDAIRAALAAAPSMAGLDLASAATISGEYSEGQADARHHVVAYDFGMKRNILRLFIKQGCRVTVVPAGTSAARVRELAPMGSSCPTAQATRRPSTTPSERSRNSRTARCRSSGFVSVTNYWDWRSAARP